MRSDALDAIQEAAKTGAVEPDLTIIAARSLAAKESPEALPQLLDLDSVPVERAKQEWAFQFGLAFHDIERARGSAV